MGASEEPSSASLTAAMELFSLLGPHERSSFESFGIKDRLDLLSHFPKRFEDRRQFDSFPTEPTSVAVTIRGNVTNASRSFLRGSGRIFEVVIVDPTGGMFGSGRITCRWFNMPFIRNFICTGHELVVFGKVKKVREQLLMDHPEFEVIRETDNPSIHLNRIVPIYRNIKGIPQRRLREIIYQLLFTSPEVAATDHYLSGALSGQCNLYWRAHFPESIEDGSEAHRIFAQEEFLQLQLNVLWRKSRYSNLPGRILGRRTKLLTQLYSRMPHDLTGAQKRTIREIVQDMRSPRPMNRLLQGDVGSGKTFVAMAAMILAVESNCQAALMAPTQILAEQHYSTFRHWLEPLGIKISLHTGNCDLRNYEESEGPSQIIIGTHALIHDQSLFQDLGLVVIDEQHRFGVAQRTKLIHRGVFPDVLVMTATPIPRTLTMTAYGDLELSMIDEKPPGRGHVRTVVRVLPKQTAINKFVAEKISAGGQVYLVYPLVEEGSSAKIESATGAITKWRKRLAGNSVSLLHGKMKAEEKEQIMNDFRTGVTSALVCTSVIEVGVDVANANLIIIHHADRFGLAQLHQLRGRVGRGGKKGYCILLTDGKSAEGLEKLRVLENNSDGFKIAEEDLKIRGPGEVLGKAQSGTAVFRFPEYLADQAMMAEARKRAEAILTEDPTLDGLHANMKCHIKTIPSMEPSAHSGPLEN